MGQEINRHQHSMEESEIKKDRSLLYMGIGLGIIILVMGYLALYVDDVHGFFSRKEEVVTVVDDNNSDLLNENSSMSDAQVRNSLVKFIEAFYTDQKKGYFDPPSYFSPITRTYYNYHNLTYKRLKDLHWKRLSDMKKFDLQWMVSSLDYDRSGNELIASYWTSVNYLQPSRSQEVSADIKYEMIINEDGKITSLREAEIKNLVALTLIPDIDTTYIEETDYTVPVFAAEKINEQPSESAESPNPEARYDGKLYDLGTVETAPEYQGGQSALAKYLGSRLRYPAIARENKIQGKVYIGFVVEKNGSLTDFKIIKGIGGGCDEEAVRVLRSSPQWRPGISNGKPVRTSYTLPITFQLGN